MTPRFVLFRNGYHRAAAFFERGGGWTVGELRERNATGVSYCAIGAMTRNGSFFPQLFARELSIHASTLAGDTTTTPAFNWEAQVMEHVSIPYLVHSVPEYNDNIANSKQDVIERLNLMGDLYDRYWFRRPLAQIARAQIRFWRWLGCSDLQIRDDLPIIDHRWRERLIVPDGLVDGWPPDDVPVDWAEAKTSV